MEIASKIFGWVLLVAGVLIIVWTLYTTYNIFTAQAELPEFFEMEAIAEKGKEAQESLTQKGGLEGLLQEQMGQMMGEQLKGMFQIPADTMPKMLNLIVWSMLAGILIFGGSQLSGLGIKLMKK